MMLCVAPPSSAASASARRQQACGSKACATMVVARLPPVKGPAPAFSSPATSSATAGLVRSSVITAAAAPRSSSSLLISRRGRRRQVAAAAAAAADDANATPSVALLAAESSAAVEAAARSLLFEAAALLGDAARGPKSARDAATAFSERASARLTALASTGLAARDPAVAAAVRQLSAQFSERAAAAATRLAEAAEAGPGGALEGGRAKAAVEELQAALADAAAGIEGAVIDAGARGSGETIERFVQQLRAASLKAGRGTAGGSSGISGAPALLGGVGGTGVTLSATAGVVALWLFVRVLGHRLAASGLDAVPAGPAALVLVPFLLYGAEVLAGPALVSAVTSFFGPAVAFCAAWLPLFCVPVVVGAIQVAGSMPTGLLQPLLGVVAICTSATLVVAGRLAAPGPPLRATPGSNEAALAFGDGDDGNLPPARSRVAWATAWTVAAALPIALTAYEAASFGDVSYFACGLAASIAGFLWARALPRRLRVGLLQPTVLGGLAAAAAAIYQGSLCGLYAGESLDLYLSAGAGGVAGAKGVWGAGDVLLALLGAATAACGFLLHPEGRRAAAAAGAPGVASTAGVSRRQMYASGAAMSRYAALRAAASAAVASLAVTTLVARLLGLAPEWGRALAVRGSVGSAAISLGDSIGAASACVGAVLLVQSVLGCALAPVLLRVAGAAAPAARGAAAGAAVGPLGVAAAADGDARALASGMLGYALAALTTVALFSWPAARALVLRAVG